MINIFIHLTYSSLSYDRIICIKEIQIPIDPCIIYNYIAYLLFHDYTIRSFEYYHKWNVSATINADSRSSDEMLSENRI